MCLCCGGNECQTNAHCCGKIPDALSYKGTNFDRVNRGFIAQAGDINGRGGESIYGQFFPDENLSL